MAKLKDEYQRSPGTQKHCFLRVTQKQFVAGLLLLLGVSCFVLFVAMQGLCCFSV